MNPSSTSNVRRCKQCGAALDDRRARELCPGCALESALDPGMEAVAVENPDVRPSASEAPSPANESGGSLASAAQAGQRFGDYELLEEISRGGMGVVFKARQVSLDRVVAIKMLLFGPLASPEVVQRFRTEAAAAASLQHPNIVAIHEVGHREGQHFFAMDYVAGRSLADIVRDGPLEPKRAATYVKTIAEAIQYAHDRGILHRDLKPSNVLIDEHEQPRVTDFGLAKRLEKETELTLSGQVLGSPNYMSPEQAAAHRGLVGKRSDVYALGAILYHLLTGRAPFVAPTVAETLAQVQTADPVSPTVLNPHLPRDLKTICLKCLEKEPPRRYQTVQELGEDLGHFLNNETIHARPVGPAGKTWRWCRRKPLVAALSAAVVLVFLLGFAGVAWQAQRATQARDLAQGRLYAAQMKLAHAAINEGKTGGALAMLRALQPRPGERDFRGFDWRYFYRLCLDSPSEVLATNASGYQSVAFSPDCQRIALGTGDGWVEVVDVRTRRQLQRWQAHTGGIDCLQFYPRNANWFGTLSGEDQGVLKLWDIRDGKLLLSTKAARGARGEFVDFAFSPREGFLVTQATNAFSLNVWELRTGEGSLKPALMLKTNLAFSGPAAFSPDDRVLGVCHERGVVLYDLTDGTLSKLPAAHVDMIYAIAFSPDGRMLATGGADERVALWNLEKRTYTLAERADLVFATSVAFTPDGQRLLASGRQQTIYSWSTDNPQEIQVWSGHSRRVNRLALAGDGSAFASASDDGTVRIWPLQPTDAMSAVPHAEPFTTIFTPADMSPRRADEVKVYAIAVSPVQDRAAASESHRLLLCDLRSGVVLATVTAMEIFGPDAPELGALSFSPDGCQLAVGSDGRIAFLDATTLRLLRKPIRVQRSWISHLAYALNGSVLVTGGGDGSGIKLTDVASGSVLAEFAGFQAFIPQEPLAVSPDGRRVATGNPDGRVLIRDVASRRILASSPKRVGFASDLAFSPDGNVLAIAESRGAISLWNLSGRRSWRRLTGLAGNTGPAIRVAFSPDGRTLASGGMDHAIRMWHPDIDQEVAILTGHTEWIWCIAFADQGSALLSGGRDGTLRLWRALSFEQIQASR